MNLVTLDNEQLTKVVAEALRQAINGMVRLQKHSRENGGGEVFLNVEGQEFQFQFTIAAPSGVNAIDRTTTTTPGTQTSTVNEPQTTETTTTDPRTNTSRTTESGRTDTSSQTETQSVSEAQNQAYGRASTTRLTYEN